ncbi:alpha/beta fold hydrolase [Williamsia sterculiae]|uniref:Pimeloyl-ACP methyl ester carboxylesterase n=1 Tax=Williamsia sterculiae TaxID=1344003 RepID=A0A1N7GWW2_9NOCA|nr:alpha/beta hydrolase [Williamsia sterculiae]SIS17064.1 Pimeloyl-ACP methyl ester carboxylesterase [Williamsia sterculiae]
MTYLHINGSDLYSEVDGTGDLLLVLHGGFCSLESMRPVIADLTDRHRILAYERPGHGRSADIDGEYSYAQGVADAVTYLDALGCGAVDVVGYSDGAIIGLMLAMAHPQRVRALVAISANLDPSAFTHSLEAACVPLLDTSMIARSDDAPDVERMHYERLSPDGPEHAVAVLDKLFRLWSTEPHIVPADLAVITARVLVMSADHDTIRPDHSVLVAASIPGAQLCVVPGATHDLLAERPQLIRDVIAAFLDEVGRHPR